MKFSHQALFMFFNAFGNLLCRLNLLIFLDGTGEGDFVAHLGLFAVNPGIRMVGQDFPLEVTRRILVNIAISFFIVMTLFISTPVCQLCR